MRYALLVRAQPADAEETGPGRMRGGIWLRPAADATTVRAEADEILLDDGLLPDLDDGLSPYSDDGLLPDLGDGLSPYRDDGQSPDRGDGRYPYRSDGPFADRAPAGYVAGLDLVEAADLDEAIALAAAHSRACGGAAVEVRPVWE
ncbi:YciI family protein [Streptomyces adustus]|uniref:YciI family protein n=1 Tax=Streptomyces adustus TaxID=1609272 RepID=UPI003715B720